MIFSLFCETKTNEIKNVGFYLFLLDTSSSGDILHLKIMIIVSNDRLKGFEKGTHSEMGDIHVL